MDHARAQQVILDIVRTGSEPLGLALIPADKPWPDWALRLEFSFTKELKWIEIR